MGNLTSSLFYSVISLLGKAIGSIFILSICARFISVEEFGNLSFTIIIATMFVLILDFGLPLRLPKEVAQNLECSSKIASKSFLLKAYLLVPYILLCLAYSYYCTENLLFNMAVFLSLAFYSVFYNVMSIYRGKDLFNEEAYQTIFTEILYCSLVAFFSWKYGDVVIIGYAMLLGRFLQLFIVLSIYKQKFSFISTECKLDDFKELMPYALQLMIAAFILYADSLILKFFVSEADVGIYQAGVRILVAAGLFINIVNTVALPKLSRELVCSQESFNNLVKIVILVSMFIGLISAMFFYFFTHSIVLIMFGEEYIGLEKYKIFITLIIFFRYLSAALGVILTAVGGQSARTKSLVFTIVLLILLGLMFIPIYGVVGAYVTSVLSTLFLLLRYFKDITTYFTLHGYRFV